MVLCLIIMRIRQWSKLQITKVKQKFMPTRQRESPCFHVSSHHFSSLLNNVVAASLFWSSLWPVVMSVSTPTSPLSFIWCWLFQLEAVRASTALALSVDWRPDAIHGWALTGWIALHYPMSTVKSLWTHSRFYSGGLLVGTGKSRWHLTANLVAI